MASHGHDEHGAVGHIVPIRLLVLTCLALLVLTVVTVWVAKFDFVELHLSEMNIIVAMGVAVVKCTLVALIFMHLRWDRPFMGFVFIGGFIFVGIFIGFTLLDTHTYQPAIIPGNSAEVQMKIDALEANMAAAAEAGTDHGHEGHGDDH